MVYFIEIYIKKYYSQLTGVEPKPIESSVDILLGTNQIHDYKVMAFSLIFCLC